MTRGGREGNRFFVSLLLRDRGVCLWIVKSCSGGPPAPAGMHTYTQKSWLPGPGGALRSARPGLARAAGSRWLQVMRFSFFCLFFFPFPFR